ncbi:MAG: hypothetical protein J0I15_14570, partial [Herbaspirillum huttiense]
MANALLKLHVEAPGTTYTNSNGDVSSSMAGHAWIELVRSDGSSVQAGFGPAETKSGVASVEGKIFASDRDAYAGDSYFTASYAITEGQLRAIERFIAEPK